MTETELLAKVATEGWTILDSKVLGTEGTGDNLLTIKHLLLCKPKNGTMMRMWAAYYVKVDGVCYWRETNPFPVATVHFNDEIRAKISSLVAAGTIKAGYIERVDDTSQTALVVAIKNDNTPKIYHVYKSGGVLNVTEVTGTYPL